MVLRAKEAGDFPSPSSVDADSLATPDLAPVHATSFAHAPAPATTPASAPTPVNDPTTASASGKLELARQ